MTRASPAEIASPSATGAKRIWVESPWVDSWRNADVRNTTSWSVVMVIGSCAFDRNSVWATSRITRRSPDWSVSVRRITLPRTGNDNVIFCGTSNGLTISSVVARPPPGVRTIHVSALLETLPKTHSSRSASRKFIGFPRGPSHWRKETGTEAPTPITRLFVVGRNRSRIRAFDGQYIYEPASRSPP